jgi:hypothetical protein
VKRRPVLLALATAGLSPAVRAQVPRSLPMRNLLVELRQGDEQQLASREAGVRGGSVTIDSSGAQVGLQGGFEARSRDASGDVVQRLLVLNGGQGRVAIGSGAPMLQWLQVVWTPSGPAVIGAREWVEALRAMQVRPRWPGGDAPVEVELRAEANRRGAGGTPTEGIDTASVLTTVQVPLGKWVTVASSGDREAQSERAVIGSREMSREQRYIVQLRVSLP